MWPFCNVWGELYDVDNYLLHEFSHVCAISTDACLRVSGLLQVELRHNEMGENNRFGSLVSEGLLGPEGVPRNLTTLPGCRRSNPSIPTRSLTRHKRRKGTSVKCVHRSHDLDNMLPLGSPCEARAPRVQDLEEGAIDGECEGAPEKGAAPGPCHHDRCKFLQVCREVASPLTHMVQSQWGQAAGR